MFWKQLRGLFLCHCEFGTRSKRSIFLLNYSQSVLLHYYRIRVIKPPLLIKPPLIQNSNKPPLIYQKSPLFGTFLVKFWKNFNKTPAIINRRRFIGTDSVLHTCKTKKLFKLCQKSFLVWRHRSSSIRALVKNMNYITTKVNNARFLE